MADSATNQSTNTGLGSVDKGKGKSTDPTAQDVSMGEEEDSSDEESGREEEVEVEQEDDDNMEEIDTANIIPGSRRTRGRAIDFAKAAQDAGDVDEDEDEDDDFVDPEDENTMKE